MYDNNETLLDSYTYSGHAAGKYSRVPDGTGEFVDQDPTKGELNIVEKEELPTHRLIINEINSQPDDWVENIYTEHCRVCGATNSKLNKGMNGLLLDRMRNNRE